MSDLNYPDLCRIAYTDADGNDQVLYFGRRLQSYDEKLLYLSRARKLVYCMDLDRFDCLTNQLMALRLQMLKNRWKLRELYQLFAPRDE